MVASPAVQPVLDAIARTAARLCEAHDALIHVVEDDSLRLIAKHGRLASAFPVGAALPLDRGWVGGRAVIDAKTIHVRDLAARKDYPGSAGTARATKARTFLATPLMRNGEATGVIVIRRLTVSPFTAKQIALLKTFADQAALAIENARLSTELGHRNAELTEALEQQTATAGVLRVISSSLTDAQPVFDAILVDGLRLCEAPNGAIFTFDGQVFRLAAAAGISEEFLAHLRESVITPGPETPLRRIGLSPRVSHVADIFADLSFSPPEAYRREHMKTLLAVPMLREGRLVGAITFHRHVVRPFTDQQIALLQTFADQAVIAIENVRLFDELAARNRELTEALEQQTATAEILRVISSSPTDIRPVFAALAASAARLCDAADASILQVDGDELRVVAHDGPIPSHPLGQGPSLTRQAPSGRAVLDRRTVHLADAQAERDEYPEGSEHARRLGFRTTLAVPLMREGVAIGSITLRRTDARLFTERQVALLQTFADQAVIAIENVRLFTELETRNRDLTEALERQTATAEILRVISGSPTGIQPTFDAIARSAARLCEADLSGLFTFDGELIHFGAQSGRTPEEIDAARQAFPQRPSDSSVTARAILSGTVVQIPDVSTDPEVAGPLRLFHTVLSVPMMRGRVPLGAITVARRLVRPFTDDQIQLVETFTDQAVIAIENVRLFTELQARNRDLTEALDQQTATGEILAVIAGSPTETRPVFEAIVSNAARLCGARDVFLVLVEDTALRAVAATGELAAGMSEYNARQVPVDRHSVAGRTIVDRTTLHVADLAALPEDEFPEGRALQRLFRHRTLLATPLLREGVAIGAIVAFRFEVRDFFERQVTLFKTFADQAVIAIENVRLFKELETRNRELTTSLDRQTATADILRVISRNRTDVQPVFDAIVQNAVTLCSAVLGSVYRRDGDLVRLVGLDRQYPEADEVRAVYPAPLTSALMPCRAIHDNAVIRLPDTEAPGALPPEGLRLARVSGFRSVVAVPMRREGDPIGAILVGRPVVGPFPDEQIALLQTFADQAVIAIENVRLFNEVQTRTTQLSRSVDELTALGEVSRALSSTLDLDTVLNTIVARASQLTGSDYCAVWEYDEGTETFSLRAIDSPHDEVVAAARKTAFRRGEGVQGQMAITHEPVQIPDLAAGPGFATLRDALVHTGTRALLAVPLLRDDHLIGGLTINKKTPGPFPPETVELLKTFATQSALAINNARLFREIEDKGRQLETASRHKSQFLANMSHELRTPLNAILGYTELIADGIYGEVPDRMREVLERVDTSGRHLLGLINDILDLSKIEAGQLTLALGPYAMDGVAQTVATQVGALAAEKRLGFEVAVADDLPIGHGDERRLTQVLLNLVGNAIKFTDAGTVTVRVGTEGDAYVVSVTDTGPGIAEGDREKIFEEFQQADTTRAKAKGGTGLGLAISRRIVQMHGGRLWVESSLGEGSTFSFTVPVHVERQVAVTRS